MTAVDLTELSRFFYFIREREAIRIKKESGAPRPWTDSLILSTYHFCNVRREDDRGTKEIRKVVRSLMVDVDFLPQVYTAARMLNKARSLEILLRIGFLGGWEQLKRERDAGNTVFHTAYVVSTAGASVDKIDYVEAVVKEVESTYVPNTTCEAAYRALKNIHGLGSFLAAQVVADLKNDRYLADAPDFDTFSVMGPGSKKGLDALFGGGTTHSNYEKRISLLEAGLPPDIQELKLHRQDLQNCLCEFSKYHRLINNLPGRRRPYT